MRTRAIFILALTVAATLPLAARQQNASPEARLQAAINKETVEGDLKAAIELYKPLAASSNRVVAAKALLRMGQCYERLGDAESRKAYERIVAQFPDQKDVVAEARKRLGARGAAAPVETGLVERHVWTFPPSNYTWVSRVTADGRLVAVAAPMKDLLRVYLLDLATGQERTVAENTNCATVVVAPDIRQVACGWMADGTGRSEIRVIQVGDGSMRTIWRGEGPANRIDDWSPDGKYILARTWKRVGGNSDWDMVLVSVADGSVKVLKAGGGVGAGNDGSSQPRFSPDGRYIVHPAARTGADGKPVLGYRGTLHIMPAAGDTEAPLVQGAASEADWSPAWTADGKRIVFLSTRSGVAAVWAVAVVNGKPQGEPERLKVRADGDSFGLLGFARDGTLYGLRPVFAADVLLAEVDPGGGKVVVEPKRVNQTHVGMAAGAVSWSLDGRWVAYNSILNSETTTLVVHDLKTGEDRDLVSTKFSPSRAGWFPGGQSLLVGNKRIDVTSGRQESIPGLDFKRDNLSATSVGLSHDGKSAYYSVDDDDAANSGGWFTLHLIRQDVQTGQKRELYRTTSPARALSSIAVSPDDRLVAFSETRANGKGVVKVISAEGGEAREVFAKSSGVGWGADGRHVMLIDAGTDGNGEFLWVPVAGGPARPTGLRCGGRAWGFAVHPDGRRVAYVDGPDVHDEIVAIRNLLTSQKPVR